MRLAVLVAVGLAACASSRTSGEVDAAAGGDAATIDAGAEIDAPTGSAGTCESCASDFDCADGWLCRTTAAGDLCLPRCEPGAGGCPAGFTCAGVKESYCAPVNGICCVDADADRWGDGVACLGADCDDDDPDRNPGEIEVCDGADNDCDAATTDGADDPGLGAACDGPDTDLCGEGVQSCSGAAGLVCNDTSADNVELCNGLDDDCIAGTPDGSADPTVGIICDGADGDLCREGLNSCAGGNVACSDVTGTTVDTCNGMDDDCNPATADGAGDPGVGGMCDGADTDLCAEGTMACVGGAPACSDTTGNNVELCNGLDDDCNPSTTDGSADPAINVACDGADGDRCNEGISSCVGGAPACSDTSGNDVEVCDTVDNDCDLAVDEGFDTTADPFNCGACGNVCSGLCCASSCTPSSATNCGACGHACTTGMLVVNELMIDPATVGDTVGEWVEIYNPNPWSIDLRGFVIRDLGTDTHTITSAAPVIIPAMSHAVLAVNASSATNGGVTVLYQYAGVDLGNAGDEVRIDAFGTVCDEVVWAGTFDVNGRSKELSRNHRNATANDTAANWCTATVVYGAGDRGTPGAENSCAL